MVDEAHITTFAVHPAWRRQRIGERLLLAFLDVAIERGAHEATLEVRLSNLPARKLYEKYGFRPVGLRPRYYSDDNEDALIMTTEALTDPAMHDAGRAVAGRAGGGTAPDPSQPARTTARERTAAARPSSRRATRPGSPSSRVAGTILANVVASQVALHAPSGGIVPGGRGPSPPALDRADPRGGVDRRRRDLERHRRHRRSRTARGWPDPCSWASTSPRRCSWVHDKPLVGVNHLEGHVYAAWLVDPGEDAAARPEPEFPLVALVVSGGHTFIAEMHDHITYRLLGTTVDDAAGEAFDKVGRLLGLGYPGGPAIQKAAEGAARHDAVFPRAWMGDSYDLSFSGLKTAARRIVDAARAEEGLSPDDKDTPLSAATTAELAWGFQDSVVDVLVTKTIRAATEVGARSIVLGGGVAANSVLRDRLRDEAATLGVPLIVPRPALCTDNGAMIGAAGARRYRVGERAGLELDARPSLAAGDPVMGGDRSTRPRSAPRCKAAGLHARHALSQNFLADSDVLSQILEAAAPEPGGRVLEIGPGLGLLTGGLLEAGAQVTAVELDRGLAGFLRDRFAIPIEEGRLALIEGDALDQDLTNLVEPPYDVVANLPYHITSPILHALLGAPPRPRRLVLMVQREVAERIAAPPGQDELPVGVRAVPRPGPGRVPGAARRPSSRSRRSTRRSSWSSRSTPTTACRPTTRSSCGDWSWPRSGSGAR